jgi:hypothetical protein
MMIGIVALTATMIWTEDAEVAAGATVIVTAWAEDAEAAGVACIVAKFVASASRRLTLLTSKM